MNRDALVVGINQYPFLKDTPTSKAKHLNTPASDAEAIALRLEEYGGFRVRRLPESIQEEQRRVDPKKLVQGDALHEAIIQLFNPVGDSVPQTALLYFAGHGLRRNLGGVTEGFLATSDSDPRKNQWGVSLRWLRELLQRSPTPDGVCPYKGLRFFDIEDAPYFYGREALTQNLIERVQVGKGNFLAVLGVSGSGKSSVLRAGLMYQLQQERRLPGTEQWKIRIFTPGEQPLVSLATAFLDEEVTDIERAGQLKAAEEAIAQGATGLARLIRASQSPRTVLIVR